MKEYTVSLINRQAYNFTGEVEYFDDDSIRYRTVEGNTLAFRTKYITCIEVTHETK